MKKSDTETHPLVIEFVKICKQQNILNIAHFFQHNLSYFLGGSNLKRLCLKACADTENNEIIDLANFSFKNIYDLLRRTFEEVHPRATDSNSFDISCILSLDNFRAAENLWPSRKEIIRYFLLSCQIDDALGLSNCADQRQEVLEQARQLVEDMPKAKHFCKCGEAHVAILQRKISLLTKIDAMLEEAAKQNNHETIDHLLAKGGAAISVIAGAAQQGNFLLMINITERYDFSPSMVIPALQLLATTKQDELFSKYLEVVQEKNPEWGELKDELFTIALRNGLLNSTVKLLRDQVAILSLPETVVMDYSHLEAYDSNLESIRGNLPSEPLHHRAITSFALQTINGCNQGSLEEAINGWQMTVEHYYRYIEPLVTQVDTTDLIKILNLYAIDYRLALRGATIAGRVDILDKIFDAIRNPQIPGFVMGTREAESYCVYVAIKNGTANVIDHLRNKRLYPRSIIAYLAAAIGNREYFVSSFNRTDFPYANDLEPFVYHLSCAGWEDHLFPILQGITQEHRKFYYGRAAKGAISAQNYKMLAQLLIHSNYDADVILDKPSEQDLYRLITLVTPESKMKAIECLAKFRSAPDLPSFRKRADAIIKVMQNLKFDFEEAYASTDLGIRIWLLQGSKAKLLPRDLFFIICSYLIGKDAIFFQPKFYYMMQDLFLNAFLNKHYGHQKWEKTEENNVTYYQQKSEGETLKKPRSEMTDLHPLKPYNERYQRNLFYQPCRPNTVTQEVQVEPEELKRKGFTGVA